MESAPISTPRRVMRALLASGILALGWIAVDLVAHSAPAAAAETIDLLPLIDETTATVTDTVESVVAPVVTTVTAPIEPIVDAVVAEAIVPLVTDVVAPVVEPIVAATAPIVAPIVAPILLPITDAVSVVDVVVPIVAPLTSVIQNQQSLVGSALVIGSLLTASLVPLLPAPANGAPRNAPLAPAAPTGPNSVNSVAVCGELNSGVLAGLRALLSGRAPGDTLPSSPTFAFDTTPD